MCPLGTTLSDGAQGADATDLQGVMTVLHQLTTSTSDPGIQSDGLHPVTNPLLSCLVSTVGEFQSNEASDAAVATSCVRGRARGTCRSCKEVFKCPSGQWGGW